MNRSVTNPPVGLTPPPAVSGVRESRNHHQNHHGTTTEISNNGRSNSLLMGGEGSAVNGAELLPKSSSSSSPPKTQVLPNPILYNSSPNSGNSSSSTQPQPSQNQQKQPLTLNLQTKTQHTHESQSGNKPNHSGRAGGGDAFLQWGQRKKSKRTVGDKSSCGHATTSPPPSGGGSSRGGGGYGGAKLRPNTNGVFSSQDASSSHLSSRSRKREGSRTGRAGAGGGGGSSPTSRNHNGGARSTSRSTLVKRSHSSAEKPDSKKAINKNKSTDSLVPLEQLNGSHHHHHHDHLTSPPRSVGPVAAAEPESHSKGNGEVVDCPRIHIGLSRKEKEEDFMAMKGTKLPHRPKKRAKAIDKALQYCFPGMWLPEVDRSRYEVRERKIGKKPRRRGLKGLESMDSDSD